MARPLRIERAGGWYHITARGNERRPVFWDDRDRRHFYTLMEEMVDRFRIALHAFVLMNNHYHLLLSLTETNLSRAVHWLNLSYSVWFNRLHDRCGHLFQGRFKSILVDAREWALPLSRYVHLNPVRIDPLGLGKRDRQRSRAGVGEAPDGDLVQERITLLRSHQWSSYRAYVGLAPTPSWLDPLPVLDLGGDDPNKAKQNYRKYVEDALREGLPRSPWEDLREQVVLGGLEFLATFKAQLVGDELEQPGLKRLRGARPAFNDVVQCVEQLKAEPWGAFRDRYGDPGRDLVLHLAKTLCGSSLKELAESAGVAHYAGVAVAMRRFATRLEKDKALRGLHHQAIQMLTAKP